jgi:hypothetical protein
MSNILLVPVHLDALVLDGDEMVVETTADFSRLPFSDGKRDVNPDVANVSEEIVSTPFENQNLLLKAGVHLHWALPDSLTKARHSPESPDTQDFPRAPNRWLVTRCNADGVVEKEWVVESDYLYPPGRAGSGVAMPYRRGEPQPFRRMGRRVELSDEGRERGEYYPKLTAVGYGEPTFAAFYPNCHSVFGFFDADYSGKNDGRQYYVTGWYSDPEQDGLRTLVRDSQLLRPNDLTDAAGLAVKLRDAADPLTLYLRGQFSAAAREQLRQYAGPAAPTEALRKVLADELNRQLKGGLFEPGLFAHVALTAETRALMDRRPQGLELLRLNRLLLEEAFPAEVARSLPPTRAVEENFKWTLTLPEGQDFPARMLCYAKLVFGEAKDERLKGERPDEQSATVAVGNTGAEALSACVAQTLGGDASKQTVEDHLEALNLSSSLEHLQLDVAPKFYEARHEKGFAAVPGGTLWAVRAESDADSAADAGGEPQGITLPDEMARLLNAVNVRQAEYDRAWQEIESLRVQLFSDWYKYMLCAYPPEDARDAYPDIDEVESYIEGSVASLNRKIARAGTLALNDGGGRVVGLASPGENGAVSAGATVGSAATLAAALAEAVNKLQAFVDSHGEAGQAYRLKQVSGPRYWRPTEPSVLIEGSVAKSPDRHGQDGRPGDGLLETQLLAGADAADPSEQNLRRRVRERIAEIGGGPEANFAFSTWEGQPWNPFLLEWEVEVFPVEHKSNLDPATGRYHEDFIADNYQLAENEVDLFFKPDRGATTNAANVYSGRSILTPHAGVQLARQAEAYLTKEVLPQYYKKKRVLMSGRGSGFLAGNMDAIQEWYETDAKSPLLGAQKREEDTGLTAIRAWQALKNSDSVSQSLSGFNEALLMHRQTPQLDVGDPLGFDDYLPFADAVRDAVRDSIYSAPEPLNDFNPIRSGAMKILRLRLVDTFGQVKDLDVTNLLTSEPLGDDGDAPLVNLPPRLVQPARVNFRWLSAEADTQEMNDHPATTPICGWVLANNLDNSLMIYDSRGKALGSLVKKDSAVWVPAPGGRGAADVDEISNPHLQKMVAAVRRWGADFLDDFITAIDSAVENIEPENFAQHQDLALLMGRPLALVRASVNLELKGLPVVHQGWNEFRQDMRREARDDNGFSRVRFPIRVGDYRQFNDGTVGYWRESGEGYEDEVFYAPQSDEDVKFKGAHLKTHKTDPEAMVFFQSVQSAPQILSLLLDPRGVVHAITGILPAKAISIPPDQYAAALQAIEITFLSTPVLTDAGKIHLPLPAEAGYQWSWLQQDARGAWSEVSSRGLVRRESFAAFGGGADAVWNELLAERWIELIDPKDSTRAGVTAKDQRKSPTLSEGLRDRTAEIEDILDRAHIGPVNPAAKFSGPQEIREGWLKLSAADGAQTQRVNSKPRQ